MKTRIKQLQIQYREACVWKSDFVGSNLINLAASPTWDKVEVELKTNNCISQNKEWEEESKKVRNTEHRAQKTKSKSRGSHTILENTNLNGVKIFLKNLTSVIFIEYRKDDIDGEIPMKKIGG